MVPGRVKYATIAEWFPDIAYKIRAEGKKRAWMGRRKGGKGRWTSSKKGGAEVVHCSGHWGHQYPFQAQAPAFQIMWDFFKTHPNNGI